MNYQQKAVSFSFFSTKDSALSKYFVLFKELVEPDHICLFKSLNSLNIFFELTKFTSEYQSAIGLCFRTLRPSKFAHTSQRKMFRFLCLLVLLISNKSDVKGLQRTQLAGL